MNVILDIDETFLHHVHKDTWDTLTEEQKENYDYTKPGPDGALFVFRPNLKKFFEFLMKNCETINIWTWNSREYAQRVKTMMEAKIPGLKFANVWASEEADEANGEYGGHKPLQWLWDQGIFAPHNTLLIDDHPNLLSAAEKKNKRTGKVERVNSGNIKNVFNIYPFEPEDDPDDAAYDSGLLEAMAEIEKILAGNKFCLRYSRMPKAKKKAGATKRSKGLRRKTSRR